MPAAHPQLTAFRTCFLLLLERSEITFPLFILEPFPADRTDSTREGYSASSQDPAFPPSSLLVSAFQPRFFYAKTQDALVPPPSTRPPALREPGPRGYQPVPGSVRPPALPPPTATHPLTPPNSPKRAASPPPSPAGRTAPSSPSPSPPAALPGARTALPAPPE